MIAMPRRIKKRTSYTDPIDDDDEREDGIDVGIPGELPKISNMTLDPVADGPVEGGGSVSIARCAVLDLTVTSIIAKHLAPDQLMTFKVGDKVWHGKDSYPAVRKWLIENGKAVE